MLALLNTKRSDINQLVIIDCSGNGNILLLPCLCGVLDIPHLFPPLWITCRRLTAESLTLLLCFQENESSKAQLLEKNSLVEKQQNKISELLQQNQKYVEQSHQLLEQRNDTFKESFQQNQSKTLLLEEEKAALTQKLR